MSPCVDTGRTDSRLSQQNANGHPGSYRKFFDFPVDDWVSWFSHLVLGVFMLQHSNAKKIHRDSEIGINSYSP